MKTNVVDYFTLTHSQETVVNAILYLNTYQVGLNIFTTIIYTLCTGSVPGTEMKIFFLKHSSSLLGNRWTSNGPSLLKMVLRGNVMGENKLQLGPHGHTSVAVFMTHMAHLA